jgi:hypothetical protein
MSFWRAQARERIAKLIAELPADATIDERRKHLRGKGWDYGWAQKVWQQEVRAYLEAHGLPPRAGKPPVFPDHVHFPFREGTDA